MRFGIGLPQRGGVDLARDVVETARGAEEAGFDSLWVYERLLFPVSPRDGMYGVDGLPWLPAYESTADPLTVMAAATAVTERVRIGSSALVASLHVPVQLAKALATLDRLGGGGRLAVGLGNGWSGDELEAVGGSLAERGRRLDETLDVLAAAWGPDPVAYQGALAPGRAVGCTGGARGDGRVGVRVCRRARQHGAAPALP